MYSYIAKKNVFSVAVHTTHDLKSVLYQKHSNFEEITWDGFGNGDPIEFWNFGG